MNNYFIQLPDGNTSINLGHITDIQWYIEPDSKDVNAAYTSRVNLTTGACYYLTSQDAKKLWSSLQRFNARQLRTQNAVVKISNFLDINQDSSQDSSNFNADKIQLQDFAKDTSKEQSDKYSASGIKK